MKRSEAQMSCSSLFSPSPYSPPVWTNKKSWESSGSLQEYLSWSFSGYHEKWVSFRCQATVIRYFLNLGDIPPPSPLPPRGRRLRRELSRTDGVRGLGK